MHPTKRAIFKKKRLTKKRQLCLIPGLHWSRQTDQFRVCALLIKAKYFWIWLYFEKLKTHKNPDQILIGIPIAKNHQKNNGLNQLLGWKIRVVKSEHRRQWINKVGNFKELNEWWQVSYFQIPLSYRSAGSQQNIDFLSISLRRFGQSFFRCI